MNKQEIFSMIYRKGHSRNKAIKYISDFLQIDRSVAVQIYDEEYLSFKLARNARQSHHSAQEATKTCNGYKGAFANECSIQGVLDAFREAMDEY